MGDEPDDQRKRGGRKLSHEDRELWRHVTRGVSRIDAKGRVSSRATPKPPEPVPSEMPVLPASQRTPAPAAPTPRPRTRTQNNAAPAAPPKPAELDRRKLRRIAKGRERIEARIDLHGMRQSEAHVALRGFLFRCFQDGLRRVLVITGKGGTAEADDWTWRERERGVLRRNVPRWLAEPELAALVIAVAPAHARHGGDGALYVTLRNAIR